METPKVPPLLASLGENVQETRAHIEHLFRVLQEVQQYRRDLERLPFADASIREEWQRVREYEDEVVRSITRIFDILRSFDWQAFESHFRQLHASLSLYFTVTQLLLKKVDAHLASLSPRHPTHHAYRQARERLAETKAKLEEDLQHLTAYYEAIRKQASKPLLPPSDSPGHE